MKTNWPIYTVEYTQKKNYHEQQHGCTERLSHWGMRPKTNILKEYLEVEARNSCKWNNLQIDSEFKKPTHDFFLKRCRRDTLRGIKMLTLLRIKQVIYKDQLKSSASWRKHTVITFSRKDPPKEQRYICLWLNQVPVRLKQTQSQKSTLLEKNKLPKKVEDEKCCPLVAAFGNNNWKTCADQSFRDVK